jgi:hypothetical protein
MAKKKDYYKILGVDKQADDATIKKAFRSLAKQYHPVSFLLIFFLIFRINTGEIPKKPKIKWQNLIKHMKFYPTKNCDSGMTMVTILMIQCLDKKVFNKVEDSHLVVLCSFRVVDSLEVVEEDMEAFLLVAVGLSSGLTKNLFAITNKSAQTHKYVLFCRAILNLKQEKSVRLSIKKIFSIRIKVKQLTE